MSRLLLSSRHRLPIDEGPRLAIFLIRSSYQLRWAGHFADALKNPLIAFCASLGTGHFQVSERHYFMILLRIIAVFLCGISMRYFTRDFYAYACFYRVFVRIITRLPHFQCEGFHIDGHSIEYSDNTQSTVDFNRAILSVFLVCVASLFNLLYDHLCCCPSMLPLCAPWHSSHTAHSHQVPTKVFLFPEKVHHFKVWWLTKRLLKSQSLESIH